MPLIAPPLARTSTARRIVVASTAAVFVFTTVLVLGRRSRGFAPSSLQTADVQGTQVPELKGREIDASVGSLVWSSVDGLDTLALSTVDEVEEQLGLGSSNAFELQNLSAYPEARCNDGSPAGYYYKPAPSDSDDWIVMLASGGWCWDEPSCKARCIEAPSTVLGEASSLLGGGSSLISLMVTPQSPAQSAPAMPIFKPMCTSTAWPRVRHLGGVLNSAEPRLAKAHKVLVPYCTSDAHMGDAAAFGLQFRGAAVVRAVLADLVRRRGLGRRGLAGAPPRLLFGGVSAGSRGAMVHLDYVKEMLPLEPAVRERVEVRGYIDSVLWIDAEPLGHHLASGDEHVGFYGFANVTKGVASFANVTHLGAECAARWGGAEQWRCLFGEYRLPLVRTPYMAIGSQFDTYQMDNDFGTCGHWGCYPHTPAEVQYAWGLANRTADLARALAVGQRFLFSSRCHRHAVSLSTWQFVMPGCGGLSLQAALLRFLEQPSELPQMWIEQECEVIGCCCRTAAR